MCNRYLSLTAIPLYLHPPQLAPAICGYKVCVCVCVGGGGGGGVGWGGEEGKRERGDWAVRKERDPLGLSLSLLPFFALF